MKQGEETGSSPANSLPDGEDRDRGPSTGHAARFDKWIRSTFVALNTELENLYFDQAERSNVEGIGDSLKHQLRDEGRDFIAALLHEGNTGDGFSSAFGVLGNVGLYLGALRRHELTNPDRETKSPFPEASSLAQHVGASIGMAPRFATAHLATHNLALHGVRKSFTSLPDEFLFIDENTRGILGLQKAADALSRIVPLGISSPVADVLLADAAAALEQVIAINARLFATLDVERFFYSVRPYYKPYRVGRQEYRGANAGDFSGINEIDLLLGLCRANDSYYSQLLVDKMPFMLPADQQRLRDCMMHRNLLDELLDLAPNCSGEPWFQDNARGLLRVCDLFGHYAEQHHDELVVRFIAGPASHMRAEQLQGITASGPPLGTLLRSLEILRDYRRAAPDSAVATRHADIARLQAMVR